MTGGWIKLHRSVLDHDLFEGRPDWLGAWMMLCLMAEHADDGPLERGQLRISIASLQIKLGWTTKKVRNFLEKLEKEGMIVRAPNTARKGTKGALTTICNYSKFQAPPERQGTKGAPIGAPEGQHNIKKEEDKKEEEVITPLPHHQEAAREQNIRRRSNGGGFWKQELNPTCDGDVVVNDGQVTLLNGLRSKWLEIFPDEKTLDLALLSVAVQPASPEPIEVQVSRQLAHMARAEHGRDRRYQAARIENQKSQGSNGRVTPDAFEATMAELKGGN